MLNCRICQIDLTQPGQTSEQDSSDVSGTQPGSSTGSNTRKKVTRKKVFLSEATATDISAGVCGHLFHSTCLRTHLTTSVKKCPTCSKSLAGSRLIKVFPTIDRSVRGPSSYGSETTSATRVPIIERVKTFNPVSYEGDSYLELKEIHTMLMADYEELQNGSLAQKDELLTKDAILSSLQYEISSIQSELDALKKIELESQARIEADKKQDKKKRIY